MDEFTPVVVEDFTIGFPGAPCLIAGPCVIESEAHVMKMAEILKNITSSRGFNFIFKASFDKANRTSIRSFRGPGLDEGLRILSKVKASIGCPVLTDIHLPSQIKPASEVVDIIQIPAFLCRQTDLYIEAGRYDIPVNVKKGQFLAPWDVENIVEKARIAGIRQLMVTERGTSFGYQRLVVDFTSLPIIRELGVPVIFDATHSLQLPGSGKNFTGGNPRFAPYLCRAAVAVGCDGLFVEVHDAPEKALSDGSNMITPGVLENILDSVQRITEGIWIHNER